MCCLITNHIQNIPIFMDCFFDNVTTRVIFTPMAPVQTLLLADDDNDDCIFFSEALEDLSVPATLSVVRDGIELMSTLHKNNHKLPDILFLDLNMPRKSGFDCLSEIKSTDKLKHLPVIIFSTSLDMEVVKLLYHKGANYYIRKPGQFSSLKSVVRQALTLMSDGSRERPPLENFILQP
jgi:CheY-like chemotaxis protein